MKIKLLILCVVIYLFNSCNGQTKDEGGCILYQKKARIKLNSYYKSNDKSLLREALKETERSLNCSKNIGSIELKLSLLGLLKDYKSGYEYIETLADKDFRFKYKKKMNYHYFLAMDYSSKGDTLNRNKFLNEAVEDILSYLDDEEGVSNNKLNEELYYDLFSIKKLFTKKQKIDIEIDEIKKKYPNNVEFFETLKNSIEDDAPATMRASPSGV